jgi:protein bicaudal C
MNTLATTGQSMDTQGATGWPMNSQDITGRPMDTQATTGWPIGTQPTTGWQMDSSSGSSGDSSDQDQVFQHENIFRVDRRKIESLMLGQFEPIKESAGDYFLRIGNQTGTTVVWPARLRVGAKKGKNPHITISGLKYQGVMEAKKIILEHFDCTLTNTITLKMDVSYNGHSYIIGKGGKTVNSVMSETGCHIHFPDSNRTNPNEKNNQVSITGDVEGIEKSRAKVRELVPLALTFDFIDVNFNANDPIFRAIQDKFNIKLMFLPKANYPDTSMAVIKGCELEASNVKEATQLLFDHISCSTGHTVSVTMNMEISPNHHSFVVGQNNSNLCFIMQSTNTKILFPDAADLTILPIKKGSVSITGKL